MATRLKARNPELVKPGHIKGILFGGPGAGKTWLALSFPAPYYIDTEGGADLRHYQARLAASGGGYMGPADGALELETIIDQVRALATERHHYKTLVIDSVSTIYHREILREGDRLGDKNGYGADKKPAIRWGKRLLQSVERLDMNVWLVAHEVAEWKAEDGKERREVGRQPDFFEKASHDMHLTIQVRKLGKGIREAVVHKSRLAGFPEYDRFYLQQNGEDVGYANFATRYGRDFIEAEPQPIVLASAEQVAEIERLLGVLKINPDDVEKWLTKANAETWTEVSEETATKTISWLLGKVEKPKMKESA